MAYLFKLFILQVTSVFIFFSPISLLFLYLYISYICLSVIAESSKYLIDEQRIEEVFIMKDLGVMKTPNLDLSPRFHFIYHKASTTYYQLFKTIKSKNIWNFLNLSNTRGFVLFMPQNRMRPRASLTHSLIASKIRICVVLCAHFRLAVNIVGKTDSTRAQRLTRIVGQATAVMRKTIDCFFFFRLLINKKYKKIEYKLKIENIHMKN